MQVHHAGECGRETHAVSHASVAAEAYQLVTFRYIVEKTVTYTIFRLILNIDLIYKNIYLNLCANQMYVQYVIQLCYVDKRLEY